MAAEKNLGGRPTKYKTEYCELLINHMAAGYSFLSFAGLIRVNQDSLYEWERVYPEFSESKKRGFELSRLFWEGLGIRIAETNKGNVTAFIFNMKNRFPNEWREKQEVEHSGDIIIHFDKDLQNA